MIISLFITSYWNHIDYLYKCITSTFLHHHELAAFIVLIHLYTIHFSHSILEIAHIAFQRVLLFLTKFNVKTSVDFDSSNVTELTCLSPELVIHTPVLVIFEPMLAEFTYYYNSGQKGILFYPEEELNVIKDIFVILVHVEFPFVMAELAVFWTL